MRKSLLVLAVGLFAVTSIVAQQEQSKSNKPAEPSMEMMMPKPGPELAKLDYFLGTWTGEETMNSPGMPPGSKNKSKTVTKRGIGGMFLVGDYTSSMGEGKNAMKFAGHSLWTYDPQKKGYRHWWFDSFGDGQETPGNWVDDKTYVGETSYEMMGQQVKQRQTYAILSPTQFTMKIEMDNGQGWMTFLEGTYTKQTQKPGK